MVQDWNWGNWLYSKLFSIISVSVFYSLHCFLPPPPHIPLPLVPTFPYLSTWDLPPPMKETPSCIWGGLGDFQEARWEKQSEEELDAASHSRDASLAQECRGAVVGKRLSVLLLPPVACSSLLVPQMLAGPHRLSSASHKTAICSSEMASSSHWLPHSCLFGSNSLTSVICVCYHFQTKDSPPPSHSTLPLWLLSCGHRGPFAVGWNGCSYATNHSGIINFLLIHPTWGHL